MDGILLIDKPSGPTSFDIVRMAKRAFNTRKVGHAGTLDPLASGLLVVCIEQGTKLVPYLMDSTKRYLATVSLGEAKDTDDSTGETLEEAPVPPLDEATVEAAARTFIGTTLQTPPVYSALKKGGESLYKKARRGEEVKPSPREVTISMLRLRSISADTIELEVECEKGTYVRSIARDLARKLGTVGHLSALRRTFTSGFSVDSAHSPNRVFESAEVPPSSQLISLKDALSHVPSIDIDEKEHLFVLDGRAIGGKDTSFAAMEEGALVRLISPDGELAALARKRSDLFKMDRVFKR